MAMTRTNFNNKTKRPIRTKAPTTGTNLPVVRNRTGPKSKYNEELVATACDLVGYFGARNQDLANYFGIPLKTIEDWIRHKEDFSIRLKHARIQSGFKTARSLFEKANGYEYIKVVVIPNQVKEYHENGKLKRIYNDPITLEVPEKLPPDAYAAHKILSILHRDIWAEVTNVNVDHKHSGDITVRKIEELSMENLTDEMKNMLFDLNLQQLSDAQNN